MKTLILLQFCACLCINAPESSATPIAPKLTDSIPASIIHFSAKKDFNRVLLVWATARENDSRFFSVERSVNGTSWSACARLDASGTTDSLSEYLAYDYTPMAEQPFYRLRVVDWSGKAVVSNVVPVRIEEENDLMLSPNPSAEKVTVDLKLLAEGLAVIQLIDISGKIRKSVSTTNKIIDLDINQLSAGIYFVRVQKNGRNYSEKLVKE